MAGWGRKMGAKKGQSSLEFLQATGIVAVFFVAVVIGFYVWTSDFAKLGSIAEARRACYEIAAQISDVGAAGNGAAAKLQAPLQATMEQYRVRVSGLPGAISVSLSNPGEGDIGTSCFTGIRGIKNSSGADDFNLSSNANPQTYELIKENTVIRNINGSIVIS
jgi:hypothetical protein